MSYYRVTHHHVSYIEADCAPAAESDCAEQVRQCAQACECESEEISEQEYNDHWAEQLKGEDEQ